MCCVSPFGKTMDLQRSKSPFRTMSVFLYENILTRINQQHLALAWISHTLDFCFWALVFSQVLGNILPGLCKEEKQQIESRSLYLTWDFNQKGMDFYVLNMTSLIISLHMFLKVQRNLVLISFVYDLYL